MCNTRVYNGGLGDARKQKVTKCRPPDIANTNLRLYRLYEEVLGTLGRLHIIPPSSVKLALNPTFKTGMRQAITGGFASASWCIDSSCG